MREAIHSTKYTCDVCKQAAATKSELIPFCNIYISVKPEDWFEVKKNKGDKTYHICSKECLRKFR